jgi:hypothetical protein
MLMEEDEKSYMINLLKNVLEKYEENEDTYLRRISDLKNMINKIKTIEKINQVACYIEEEKNFVKHIDKIKKLINFLENFNNNDNIITEENNNNKKEVEEINKEKNNENENKIKEENNKKNNKKEEENNNKYLKIYLWNFKEINNEYSFNEEKENEILKLQQGKN